MLHRGGCHCGQIRFAFEGQVTAVVSCNCSICSRKGALLWAAPLGDFTWISGRDEAGRYRFNNNAIEHRFCTSCGISPVSHDAERAYVNLRCVDGFDPGAVEVIAFDGAAL